MIRGVAALLRTGKQGARFLTNPPAELSSATVSVIILAISLERVQLTGSNPSVDGHGRATLWWRIIIVSLVSVLTLTIFSALVMSVYENLQVLQISSAKLGRVGLDPSSTLRIMFSDIEFEIPEFLLLTLAPIFAVLPIRAVLVPPSINAITRVDDILALGILINLLAAVSAIRRC